MRLHALQHGYIEAVDAPFLSESGDPERVTALWPVRCHLLEHPGGWLLWDTGLPEAPLRNNPTALDGSRKVITNPLEPWLAGFGLGLDSDILIGLSHMHIDHGGNVIMFPNARFLIAAREFRHATSPNPGGPYYRPGYEGLTEDRVTFTDEQFDVFGDGVAVIYPAPGHSPGHQALLLSLPGDQPLLLIGDAIYSPDDLTHRRAAAWNYNHAQTFRTLDNLLDLAQRHGAHLAIHHDPDAPV